MNITTTAAIAVIAIGMAKIISDRTASADPDQPPTDDTDQLTTVMDDISVTLDPTTYTPADVPLDTAAANQRAFLDMLAYAEGTAGENGYRTLFGGRTFASFADHPRIAASFTNKAGKKLWTSAAGRYQFMAVSQLPSGAYTKANTWDTLQKRLGLPDFGPASQDAAALELVRERGALADVQAGRLEAAIKKCAPVWASLPGAGYAQPERKLSNLLAAYQGAGGTFEA